MTPISTGMAQALPAISLSDVGLSSDEQRAQELDKYYTPTNTSVLRLTERDSALPAHMQLLCWRLGMRRALVSLINRDTQYYVAESTKTMDLHSQGEYVDENDAPLSLHASHPKTGILCAETIRAVAGSGRKPPYFEVCDLAADPKFSQLNIVEELKLAYYCGVPITTSNNIVIGTVFVLDDKVREPLSSQHIQCKGISQTYMDTKMFTSFAQENPLAPGTGLGLSLVRSLVEMMNGEIEVRSEVNRGTQVTVRIPMKRGGSHIPRDGFHRPNEDDIQTLRTILPRPRIVNFQQDILPKDTPQKREGYEMQKRALAACINGWYKIDALDDWDMVTKPDIILVDDIHLLDITKHLRLLEEFDAVVVILSSDRSRTTAISKNVSYPKLHVMPKPFGPFKLAKALKHALDKRGPISKASSDVPILEEFGPIPELKQLSPTLRRIPSYSQNLSKRTKKPSDGGFPFPPMLVTSSPQSPTPSIPGVTPQIEVTGTYHRRLKTLDVPMSDQEPLEKHDELMRSHSEGQMERVHRKPTKPKILLVDNNEVNLKLLQTFFIRRGFTDMKLARDGVEAVKVYEDALQQHTPFHLVFMDISMPVMDGFEATKIIRQKEILASAHSTDSYHSLVIALTGNASAEDQTDAFTNGMDMYMTKPVSLKDVGELMKAWEDKTAVYGARGARFALLEGNATSGES
ncbi:hypothetical protein KCU71_g2910, partial [Aureobasidium melanogenum]